MKSKIRLIILACFIAGVAVTGFHMAQNNQRMGVSLADIAVMAMADGESGGNQATCYSTYTETGIFGGTMIWVCGSCVQVEAKSFSDSGICYF